MRSRPPSIPLSEDRASKSERLEQLNLDLETAARKKAGAPPEKPEALQQTLYDLRVHQIELEMQNEELRRAQVELDLSRARYFDLYDLAPVGYCTLDETGQIVQANLTAVTLLGVPRSKLLKRLFARFVSREDHGSYQRLLAGGERRSAELRMKREDGSSFWAALAVTSAADQTGAIERRLVMSDVTDRKTAETALLESQARYRELFFRASDGIVISTVEGVVVEANEAFARMHGLSPAEVVHQELKSLESAHTALAPAQARRLALGEVLTLEVEHRHRAGHSFPVEASIGEISVSGVPHVLGLYREISERKRTQAAFAQSDRLASMGMLAAGIAHEINNPLTYVLANVESVADELPLVFASVKRSFEERGEGRPEKATARMPSWEILDDLVGRTRGALEGALRIKTIARALGAFSRTESTSLGNVDLNRALETAATMAHNEIKYRATLVKQLGEVPPVLASEGKLVQVFLNLLINAAQAITEGHVAENRITLRTWGEGESVFAEVLDTGRGIPAENLARVFEPFFTTKHEGVSGSGLGLSISKTLIAEVGGGLRVDSVPGRTSFVVTLPRSESVAVSQAPALAASSPTTAAPTARGRILVVDDEEPIRKMIQRVLSREHEVVAVASGKQAKAILLMDPAFDVILCDLMMPEMTGMELHAWLVAAAPHLATRVIFISGGAFTPTATAYLSSVTNQLVTKPFFLGELTILVRDRVEALKTAPQP